MKKSFEILSVLALAFAFSTANAQQVSPVDFMRMNPYQMKANPATNLPYESVMSLLIGDIGLNVQNTTLRYNNIFDFDTQGRPATINLRQLANSLKEKNFVGLDAHIDLFTLYRRLGPGMLTVNWGIKVESDMRFNDGLFKLLGYGNSSFLGESNPVNVNVNASALAYQEFAAGYQINISDQFSVGGRAKLLFGVANVTTDAFEAQLVTDPTSYALRLRENIALKVAMPYAVYVNEAGELKGDGPFGFGELFRNPGFGIDLGAEYRFNDQFSAVAAVNDLGFIHWGKNNFTVKSAVNDAGQFYDNGDFLFNGLEWDQLEQITSDGIYREQFLDTLKQYFQLEYAPLEKYNTALHTNLLLRGNYDLDAHNRFSAQVQGRFLGSGFRPAFTLAYNGYFYEKLDVCVTYTIMPHSYDNIGLGISGRLFKTCNIYLTTNNVIGLFAPLNASGMNVQCGIVFTLRPEDKNNEYE